MASQAFLAATRCGRPKRINFSSLDAVLGVKVSAPEAGALGTSDSRTEEAPCADVARCNLESLEGSLLAVVDLEESLSVAVTLTCFATLDLELRRP